MEDVDGSLLISVCEGGLSPHSPLDLAVACSGKNLQYCGFPLYVASVPHAGVDLLVSAEVFIPTFHCHRSTELLSQNLNYATKVSVDLG